MKNYATKFINKNIEVTIDRPLNSKHPKHDIIYETNYGYIKNTKAPDGEEIDAYVIGPSKPLKKFFGTCIAVIHRLNDEDDKLIITDLDKNISDEEIINTTNFQEKYFKSIIIRQS